jgi:hypothetical protein
MPHLRPLITASSFTALAAALAITFSSGHSPFAQVAVAAADQPVAAADATNPTASPAVAALLATDAPSADPSTADRTASSAPTATTPGPVAVAPVAVTRSAPTWTPTSRPTARPTSRPTAPPVGTAAPTPSPIPQPTAAPRSAAGSLSVSVAGGSPVLSWTACSAANFAAYAVVRSTDSEIHFPAEDHDTLVAMVTSAGSTRLADTGAPAGVRVWYAVWCLSQSDGEYKTIWKTPAVSVTP